MEENENGKNTEVESKVNVSEVNTSNSTTEASKGNKIVETLKSKRNLIIGIIVAVIVVVLICTAFIGSPKKAVKNFCSAMNSKMFDNIDMAGMYVFAQLDEDDYDDFWDEYKEFTDSDEWEDLKDEIDEEKDDAFEKLDDALDDADVKVKIKKFKKVKKLGENLWEVKAQFETKVDGDKETNTSSYYVMKKGGKYKIVGGDGLNQYKSMF